MSNRSSYFPQAPMYAGIPATRRHDVQYRHQPWHQLPHHSQEAADLPRQVSRASASVCAAVAGAQTAR